MNVIVAGGRDFDDYPLLISSINDLPFRPDTILCGGARGADHLGKIYARLTPKTELIMFPADWKTHGKRAGILRNIEMAANADALLAFWDGKSRGTKHMIDTALERGLLVKVVRYDN